MNNIKAVFFDADDTLVDHKECERQALLYMFNNIGIRYMDEYQNIFRPLDRKLWEGKYNCPVPIEDIPVYRFQRLFELINVEYDYHAKANDLFMDGLAKSTALSKNSEAITEYLYNKGLVLCVVTNGLVKLQKPRVTNSKIGKFISHIIVSEEVKAHKPNPLMFNTLIERIGIDPSNVVIIGDSLEKDVQGAKNANINSIWYNPEHLKNETNIYPDYEINDFLQIKDMI